MQPFLTQMEDLYLPDNNDLEFQFHHGYVVHNKQAGMYKLELNSLQYDKNIDLANYHCQPKYIAFVPIGELDCVVDILVWHQVM